MAIDTNLSSGPDCGGVLVIVLLTLKYFGLISMGFWWILLVGFLTSISVALVGVFIGLLIAVLTALFKE